MTHALIARWVGMLTTVLGTAVVLLAPRPAAAADARLEAMRAELARSQKGLCLDGYDAPYYVAYQVWDVEEIQIAASLGALTADNHERRTVLDVDVRVGSYELDNHEDTDSTYETIDRYQPSGLGPIAGDPAVLSHGLWLITDFRYKEALQSYSRTRGRRVFEAGGKAPVPSFSREEPSRALEPTVAIELDRETARARALRLSALFRAQPDIFDSEVRVEARRIERRIVTTEGTELLTTDRFYGLHATGYSRAEDGMLLDHSYDVYWREPGAGPDDAAAERAVAQLMDELIRLRTAPVLDPYTGPAILAPQATGVFFHEVVGHRLEGQRQKDEEEGQTFRGQVGRPVLPTFLSILDDPTLVAFEGTPLNGAYRFDEEGVAAERTSLVEDGVLRNFLLSRRPIEGFTSSNGHGRAAFGQRPVARMGNLMILADEALDETALKARLLEEARKRGKPFGLLIKSISGGSTNTSTFDYQAFKGMPRLVYKVDAKTGEETLARGVEFVGTPLASLNRIVAAGQTYEVFNGYCGAESGWVPVSAVAPAMLFEEIELQRSHRPKEKPQVLPPPGWPVSDAPRGGG